MKQIRDIIRLLAAIILFWIYIPHLILTLGKRGKMSIGDAERMASRISISIKGRLAVLYFLHNNRYYRNLFYYRIGPITAMLIGWWRPGSPYFEISYTTKIGKNMLVSHPFSTEINAESIGDNFSCIHCTTLGKKGDKRPTIGNNVTLGANVLIIGGVHIGNDVIIGAGAVVVKDIPNNSVAAGNPARVIKTVL